MCRPWCPDINYDTGKDYWSTFHTENADFNLAPALNGRDPKDDKALPREINCVAPKLLKMQDAGVPDLFVQKMYKEGSRQSLAITGIEACKMKIRAKSEKG